MSDTEANMLELQAWRATVFASIPSEPVGPIVVASAAEVLQELDDVTSSIPYVLSMRDKHHMVAIGYPDDPRAWRTKSGWFFGLSSVARPVHDLPTCHKLICDRCLGAERDAAKLRAESRVCEAGCGSLWRGLRFVVLHLL